MSGISINPQYIKNEAGQDVGVFLTTSEFRQLLEELEELEDIKAFDEAKNKDEESIPFRQALEEIKNGLVR